MKMARDYQCSTQDKQRVLIKETKKNNLLEKMIEGNVRREEESATRLYRSPKSEGEHIKPDRGWVLEAHVVVVLVKRRDRTPSTVLKGDTVVFVEAIETGKLGSQRERIFYTEAESFKKEDGRAE